MDRDILLAWQCVRVYTKSLVRGGYKLPDPRGLMTRRDMVGDTKKVQTVEEQRVMLHALADMYGLRVRKQGEPAPPAPKKLARRRRGR